MLGEWSVEVAEPLGIDVAYVVGCTVEAARRTTGARTGVSDMVTVRIELRGPDGVVHVTVRPTYVFRGGRREHRRQAAGVGRGVRRPGEEMKVAAALLQDPNMIHLDPVVTERLGMGPRVVNQGPLNLGCIHMMLERSGRIIASRLRFHGNVVAGDRVVAGGLVTAMNGDVVDCEVWLDVTGGSRAVSGTTACVLADGRGAVGSAA
jgi:3-hydroxybutyryl-CoA dehydratase